MEVEEHAAAVENGSCAPSRKCRLGSGNCCRDLVARTHRNLGNRLSRCRIVLNKNFAARNLGFSVDVNGTGLKLSSDGTAGHGWASRNVGMLGRSGWGINLSSNEMPQAHAHSDLPSYQ